MKIKPVVRIAFTDFPGPTNPDSIQKLLVSKYDVVIDNETPEFVFHSVSGYEYLRFPDAIRIFFTGENVSADFNLTDFAFGFDRMSLQDRYYRCPNYMLYDEFRGIRKRGRTKVCKSRAGLETKQFCNFIYSNGNAHPFRDELYRSISKYRKVLSAGRHLNNCGDLKESSCEWSVAMNEKINFQAACKFSMAIENSSTPGYTTEKLVHALAADTIPIYWGDPEVGKDFNTKRFINCHEYCSIEEIVARVREIDQDDKLFSEFLEEPFFPNGIVPDGLKELSLLEQFENIFSSDRDSSRRRNPYVWGPIYESRRVAEINAAKPQPSWLTRNYRTCRSFFGGIVRNSLRLNTKAKKR